MTTLPQAKEAIDDNLQNHINSMVYPKMFNVTVALRGIVESLARVERDLAELKRRG